MFKIKFMRTFNYVNDPGILPGSLCRAFNYKIFDTSEIIMRKVLQYLQTWVFPVFYLLLQPFCTTRKAVKSSNHLTNA